MEKLEKDKNFINLVREKEIKLFPEFKNLNLLGSDKYNYFSPSWHFDMGLIKKSDMKDLKSKKILSIGSGPAYLERFLVSEGIPKENITLSDKDFDVLPKDFERVKFDIYEKWPNLGKKFDLIIFPECVGKINIKSENFDERVDLLKNLISNAEKFLRDKGEIRIDGHCQRNERIEAVKKRLKKENPDLKLTNHNDKLIVLKKDEKGDK